MKIDIYDNEGKTLDRYTVFIDNDVFSMSDNPFSPQGFNQYCGTSKQIPKGKHLGAKIDFRGLPYEVQQAIVKRIL